MQEEETKISEGNLAAESVEEKDIEDILLADAEEVGVSIQEIEAQSQSNLDLFASLALPEEIKFAFPDFFHFLWLTVTSVLFKVRDFSKYAIALPRGHGKTMVVKFLILYIILFTKRRFVAVICAKQDLAENILADVWDMLGHQNIRNVFGDFDGKIYKDAAEQKRFHFRGRDIILKAEGAKTAFRGVNIKNARPDVMIFDDSQTKDCAKSETQALDYIQWFQGTAMKAKDPTKCTYLYVGNMYANFVLKEDAITGKKIYGCHLRNLKDDPSWKTIITGGILADGTALWEELQPKQQLMEEFESDLAMGMPEVFYAEVMNDPDAQINTDFDFDKVPFCPWEDPKGNELFEPDAKFLVIDPSLGQRDSDLQPVGEFGIYDGKPVFRKLLPRELTQVSAPNLVFNVIKYCLENDIHLIITESYGYQKSLAQWFQYIVSEKKLEGIAVVPINRGNKSKTSSILEVFKAMQTTPNNVASLYLGSEVKSAVFSQIRTFDKTSKNNRDDILDVCYYGNLVMSHKNIIEQAYVINGVTDKSSGEVITSSGQYY